ncbi:MAG: biotin synthase BioB [Candidatus Syntropharchaeia archaeon]
MLVDNMGEEITFKESLQLLELSGADVMDLFSAANRAREKHFGKKIGLCAIVNAKSGRCPEDCAFCAQSSRHNTQIQIYPLIGEEKMLKAAREAKKAGANRFSIVTSGRSLGSKELERIVDAIRMIKKETNLHICASLGFLDEEKAEILKDAGVERYHHNLETSESFFSRICTTHSHTEKKKTIISARNAGMEICSGGILGMGESRKDRIEMAFTLRELKVNSIPINILNPIRGTRLENAQPIPPMEILKTISVFRLILPDKEIRLAGGREINLRDLQSLAILAGANGIMIGNYLTTPGRDPEEDIRMIRDLDLEVERC